MRMGEIKENQNTHQLLTNFEKMLVCSDQQDFIQVSKNIFGNKSLLYQTLVFLSKGV